MSDDPLFRDRTPEAAARNLAVVLAYLAECQLATVEMLAGRRSCSRSDYSRHLSIAASAAFHCMDLNVEPRGLLGRECGRLAAVMTALREAKAYTSNEIDAVVRGLYPRAKEQS